MVLIQSAPDQSTSHLTAGQDVSGQLDLGEVALPDGLQKPVVPDVRQLVRTRGDGVPTPRPQRPARPTGALLRAAG